MAAKRKKATTGNTRFIAVFQDSSTGFLYDNFKDAAIDFDYTDFDGGETMVILEVKIVKVITAIEPKAPPIEYKSIPAPDYV